MSFSFRDILKIIASVWGVLNQVKKILPHIHESEDRYEVDIYDADRVAVSVVVVVKDRRALVPEKKE